MFNIWGTELQNSFFPKCKLLQEMLDILYNLRSFSFTRILIFCTWLQWWHHLTWITFRKVKSQHTKIEGLKNDAFCNSTRCLKLVLDKNVRAVILCDIIDQQNADIFMRNQWHINFLINDKGLKPLINICLYIHNSKPKFPISTHS